MTWTDSRHRPLAVGQRVAYNRSGDVVEGEIVHLTRSAVHIQPSHDYQRPWSSSPLSKVKRGSSIMVLPPEDNWTYEKYEIPCPHRIPCGGPCQPTVYRRVRT